jgi:membrane-bound lytic murein transglycosylase B
MDSALHKNQSELLSSICQKHGVPQELIEKLLGVEKSFQGMMRRHGVRDQLRDEIKRQLRSKRGQAQ